MQIFAPELRYNLLMGLNFSNKPTGSLVKISHEEREGGLWEEERDSFILLATPPANYN